MHHPTDRIAHTMAFVTPVVEHWLEREIAQWVGTPRDNNPMIYHIVVNSVVLTLLSCQVRVFNMHIQSKLLQCTPVTGTYSFAGSSVRDSFFLDSKGTFISLISDRILQTTDFVKQVIQNWLLHNVTHSVRDNPPPPKRKPQNQK